MITLLIFAYASSSIAAQSIGATSIVIDSAIEERPLSLTIWYPTQGGTPEEVGGNAVFVGVEAVQNAPLPAGQSTLVLVSHGGLRSADNSGAWLSARLAQAGYIAVEINGRRPELANEAVNEFWQRTHDMSTALDAISDHPLLSKHVDPEDIHAIGFALGGTSALALAGGRIEPQSFIKSCDGSSRKSADCAWYDAQGVALKTVDQKQLAVSRRDERFRSVVAIDPEYLHAFMDDMALVTTPALLISLGSESQPGGESQINPSVNTENVIHDVVEAATTFDAFNICTPSAPSILAQEGGNSVMCGTSSEARMQAHAVIIEKAVQFITTNSRAQQ